MNKNTALILIAFVMIIYSILYYAIDSTRIPKQQQTLLYQISLNRDTITDFHTRLYTSGRKDTYRLFKVSSKDDYYPILLNTNDRSIYNLFQIGSKISKSKNSNELELETNGDLNKVDIRHPDSISWRKIGNKELAIIFGLIMIILIFIPKSLFEKRLLKKQD